MEGHRRTVGLPPGTPVHTGARLTKEPTVTIIDFDEVDYRERVAVSWNECTPPSDKKTVRWIHVQGLHELELIKKVGSNFNIHDLILEDITHTQQRPKMEILKDSLYLLLRAFDYDSDAGELLSEQVSILTGDQYVISLQESEVDLFDPIKNRLSRGLGRIRKGESDYLTYSLVDLIVDRYFLVLEGFGDRIEALEDKVIKDPTNETLQEIYRLRRNTILLRRHVWPLREIVSRLNREESSFISNQTQVYLRDLHDHVVQVNDLVETYRDSLTGILDIYLSSVSNRLNEVMKILTVISTIFIPLTLLASIYGMNFWFMPELANPYSYPVLLVVMLLTGSILLFYFRKKGWI
ncbi:MAG: magnesium/cobalt transporter CorA [Candidatus Thorarchaeota archaeon SMTZ1-83]|nr:MAG: magnesium transporter [Candidatus Thorarchaeota archaeon SMTZ1-83]